MQIVKGKVNSPVKTVIYGPEGIGKTTFASQWPEPLFVDCEGGTMRLAVDRVSPGSFSAVEQVVAELTANTGGYKTLVFDTADWLEKLMIDHVCAKANQASIEAFGYGKGYTHLAECWRAFLDKVTRMQAATGMHVVFLAHAAMRKQELPDEAGAFDRWELKLLKQSPGVLKEWADLVLLLNYKTLVVDVDGHKKAQGGRRVMYSTHHACWDAKNRFGLPDEMPLEFAKLASVFADVPTAKPPTPGPHDNPELMPASPVATPAPAAVTAPANPIPVAPVPTAAVAASASSATVPHPSPVAPPVIDDPEKVPLLAQLAELMKGASVSMPELGAELERKGVVKADMNPRQYNLATLNRVISGFTAIVHNINIRIQQTATEKAA